MIIAGVFPKPNIGLCPGVFEEAVARRAAAGTIRTWRQNNALVVTGSAAKDSGSEKAIFLNEGLFLGKAFHRRTFSPICEQGFEECVLGSFDSLGDNYWGSYVAIRMGVERTEIIRDISGQLPLFYAVDAEGSVLIASEIELLFDILPNRPRTNWNYISSFLLRTFISSEQTPFDGVFELPHGCKVCFGRSCDSIGCEPCWNPLRFVGGYCGPEETRKAIIDVSTNVIRSWTMDSKLLSLDFSGGVDSTAILYMANSILKNDQELKLVNMFHPQVASSDERRYARRTAEQLGFDIVEFDYSRSMPYDEPTNRPLFRPNWPTSLLSFQKINDDIGALFNDRDKVTYISGHGGDHLFMTCPPVTSISDYYLECGTKGLAGKVRDLYIQYREPFWVFLSGMIRGTASYYMRLEHQVVSPINRYYFAPWLSKDVFRRDEAMSHHPFFHRSRKADCLPGKWHHIEAIYNGLATIRADMRDGGTNPVFFPLFSQPLIEIALSIPTYESFHNGYSRFLFRDAVSRAYRTDAVWRRDKGFTGGVSQRGLKKNQKRLLELCMDGELTRQGLVDKDILRDGIYQVMAGVNDFEWAVTNVICAETFLGSWKAFRARYP